MSQDVVSFVLRFVREIGEDQQARWRGIIKHVQGDAESHFSQFSEALQFMQARVNEVILATFDGANQAAEEHPFLETARLWGEFMPRYTRLVMDSMQEAMSGSPAVAQQMEKNMAATMAMWGLPSQQDQVKTAATLEIMAGQLQELASTMATLEARLAEQKARPAAEVKPEGEGRPRPAQPRKTKPSPQQEEH